MKYSKEKFCLSVNNSRFKNKILAILIRMCGIHLWSGPGHNVDGLPLTLSHLIVREIVPIINSNSFFSLKPPIEENWVRGEKPVD